MAVISGSWKAFDMLCGQIAENGLMHEKPEVLVESVIYSNFQIGALDGDSLYANVSSFSFLVAFPLFPAHRYKGHKLFKDHLLHLRAELPVQKRQKEAFFFFFSPFFSFPFTAEIVQGRGRSVYVSLITPLGSLPH